ncbi:hypothetical protein SCMU_17580 [Sinomonas cyclohexanicum]|uniref:Uncharacterized protein n=1 Tax=Sinomonas cyclohexanicum TaxID=322009 RepID=A0ABN6FIP1_SINCY|nr:hypothetical protein [Corynebacterium cyclohexanicum]BCT75916.1 hypothetical protein SCMU_17580 [Corynebacterium cyclohexanicum]
MTPDQGPRRHEPGSDDDAWRDLVARLGEDGAGPAPRELSAAERAASAPRGGGQHGGLARPAAASGDAHPPEGHTGAGHDDGGGFSRFDPLGLSGRRPEAQPRGPVGDDHALPGDFVPDEPEPILAGADPVSVLAWCGALGGPVALLTCALVWRTVPGYVIAMLVAAFVAGVGTLIMRLPRSKDDDGDDGARV